MNKRVLQRSVIALGVSLLLGCDGPQYNDLTYDEEVESGGSTSVDTPSGVEAASAFKGVLLTWDEDSDASGFLVCYAEETIDDFDSCEDYEEGTYVSATSDSSLLVGSLSTGQIYYFRVAAQDDDGDYSAASANVSAKPTSGLNDTGITVCRELSADNVDCPSESYPGQDGDFGLDAAATDNSDGHAGFDFTFLNSDGDAVSSSASCVRDNVTGLIWETKKNTSGDGSYHDGDDTFTWYSTNYDTNAGTSGDQNEDSDTCYDYDSSDSSTYCNTKALIARVNSDGYCGLNNWRLPTRQELISIVNYDVVEPAIDLAVFPYAGSTTVWSGTSVYSSALSGDQVWTTNFTYGGSGLSDKTESYRVRLVSEGE